jgi:hypothetical protein
MATSRKQPTATEAPVAPVDAAAADESKSRQRSRLSQEDVPGHSLDQALRVPKAIADSYAYKPTRPLNVAGAMKVSPSSGGFRMMTGAAIAYGLTTGGAFAPVIAITPLGLRIVRPTKPGDDMAAKREALLRPKIIGEFLRTYDGAALPPDQIAKNVLLEKGVPAERLDEVLALILDGAQSVGYLKDINGKKYVDLGGAISPPAELSENASSGGVGEGGGHGQPGGGKPAANVNPGVSLNPGVNINVEIHIAADASATTIQEIFKNMRKYVLGGSDDEAAEE